MGHYRFGAVAVGLVFLVLLAAGCGDQRDSSSAASADRQPSSAAATENPPAETPPESEGPERQLAMALRLAGIDVPRGLRTKKDGLLAGYVLFAPMLSGSYYLVDRDGRVVHTWDTDYSTLTAYLLDDGSLLRSATLLDAPRFTGGGVVGRIERLSWDGELLWSYELATDERQIHHDIERLPNGNVLAIAWEHRTREDAIAAGRRPDKTPADGLWPDVIIEIEPTPPSGGTIVWEWRYWDHMVQDHDPSLPNYGELSANPRKIDINAGPPLPEATAEQIAFRKRINFTGHLATVGNRGSDMHHTNAVAYNPDLDQIVISSPALGEIFVIDHSLSSEEAATDAGDPLYRWGNPANYGRSEEGYERLSGQHDVHWIADGLPGAGSMMLFNNEPPGAEPPYSEVLEFTPPVDGDAYVIEDGKAFGPTTADWRYSEPGAFAPFISGTRRLLNGNTLVTYGPQGRFVEVTREGDVVWEYWSPYSGRIRRPDGQQPMPVGPFQYAAFRSTFIPADHPAIAGRDLSPLDEQPPGTGPSEEELAPYREAARAMSGE